MNMRKYFTILLLCFLPVSLLAQSGVSTSLFTGRMSYTIPIYTIEDPDFNLDIALRYSSDGFKPFQPSGCYGQDWTLVAGGCITRQVMGMPDEWVYANYNGFPGGHTVDNEGAGYWGQDADYRKFGFKILLDTLSNPLDKELIFNFDASIYDPRYSEFNQGKGSYRNEWRMDLMPDIFYFSFCGHSGSFMLNNTGKVVILSGDFVQVDMSAMTENTDDLATTNSTPSSTRITIKTTDGYTYNFGNMGTSSVEYTVSTFKNTGALQDSPAITAWHLTEITAPNGRRLFLNYISSKSFLTDYDWTEEGDSAHIMYSLHKDCLLKSITTSDATPLEITFNSAPESHKMYADTAFGQCPDQLQLNSIVVKCGDRELKRATLSYAYRSSRNMTHVFGAEQSDYYWRYLSAVTISGVGKYTMTYANINPYEQGNQNNASQFAVGIVRYPFLNPATDDAYKKMVDRFGFWKVSSIASLQGMLQQVTLPTGGHIDFKYGTHDYSTERRFSIFAPTSTIDLKYESIMGGDKPIGGARIEMIKLYESANKEVETTTFSYKKSGKSTGVFYNIYEIYDGNKRMAVVNPYNYNMINTHVGYWYAEKELTIGSDKSKTTYSFDTGKSSYLSYNNSTINRRYDIREQKYGSHIYVEKYNRIKELCSGSLTHDQWLTVPGKLLKTEYFRGGEKYKVIQYTYNNGATSTLSGVKSNIFGCVDTIVCASLYSAYTARKLFVCPDVLEKVTTYEYESGQMMETIQEYRYDSKLREKETTTTDSRGKKLFTRYTYPDEVPGGVGSAYKLLAEVSRINRPVETISGYVENGIEYITGGALEIYSTNSRVQGYAHHAPSNQANGNQTSGVNINPDLLVDNTDVYPTLTSTWKLIPSNPLPVGNYQRLQMNSTEILRDPNYILEAQYKFNRMYRLESEKSFGKRETKYAWEGLYPVTKTIGNQTWKYEYIPYVGVKSMTDPRGNTTYYEYDANGRLIEEYTKDENGNKQILNVYQYHIKSDK